MQTQVLKLGDRLQNPLTGKINTVTNVEENHYYRGDNSYGNFYTLEIESEGKEINLTPIMASRFTKL